MSLIKTLFPTNLKFTPASSEVNWTRINTLVHGPGASEYADRFNSAVLSCLLAIAMSYVEPPLRVYRRLPNNKREELADSPLQALLDRPTPNGELTQREVRFWIAWAKHVDGNAYLLKVRARDGVRGNVIQLWPVSPTRMEPVTVKDSGDWISYYRYQVKPGVFEQVPVENVIHYKAGLLDRDMRKGLSRIKHLIREMATDDEAERFSAALLKNYAIPGLVVWPTAGNTIQEDDADRITAKLRQKFGGDGRGNIAVMSRESKAEQFGFSPEQMNLTQLHRLPEERISGVMGIPALLAGLGAGLDRATYSNARELREFFTETKLIPEWQLDEERLDVSLTQDFTNDKSVFIAHDITNVRALQEDMDKKYQRLSAAVGRPFVKPNEARSEVGLEPRPEYEDAEQTPPPAENGQNMDEMDATDEAEVKLRNDLAAYERKAVKAFQANDRGRLLEDFTLSAIPAPSRLLIQEMLEEAKSVEDVRKIFAYPNGHTHS